MDGLRLGFLSREDGSRLGQPEDLLAVGGVCDGARREGDDDIAVPVQREGRGLVDGGVVRQGPVLPMGK